MQQHKYQLVYYKSHCFLYRGFNIYKLPRNTVRKITQYRVMQGDNSFGLFDALAEVTGFIDGLYEWRKL
ncbi:TPA: hypothetical protein RG686_000176 [Morganella morganii]|uniref:hypothetical protein n=1 Tax=Morganella morganii TaxID=582 RepID=UPI002360B503|nr:hypothetical protein [Morganella morganii]HDU8562921.1 hypothetical protein [Morganella morganii]